MENYKIIFTEEQIKNRVQALGETITKDYAGKSPVIICMLKGAVYFFADLVKHIKLPVTIDFARISSYKTGTSSGEIEFISNITENISGKDVIIVEDIVDTGKTLSYFIEFLKTKNPLSIKVCSFLDKKSKRITAVCPDYCGFEISDLFVIGYGLDYAEKYRELPFLAELILPKE